VTVIQKIQPEDVPYSSVQHIADVLNKVFLLVFFKEVIGFTFKIILFFTII